MGQQHVMRTLCQCSINDISRDVTYDVYTGFAMANAHHTIRVLKILLGVSSNEVSPASPHSVRAAGVQR